MMPETFELDGTGGAVLRGQVWPASERWTLLVHDYGTDIDAARSLVDGLLAEELTAFAADLRGHGLSEGEWDPVAAAADVELLVALAHERGARELFAVAFGQGASVLTRAAARASVDAAVLISPENPHAVGIGDELRAWRQPKLLLTGSQDLEADTAARAFSRRAVGPWLLIQVPTAAQGHALLQSPYAGQVLSHTVGFLAQNRCVLT